MKCVLAINGKSFKCELKQINCEDNKTIFTVETNSTFSLSLTEQPSSNVVDLSNSDIDVIKNFIDVFDHIKNNPECCVEVGIGLDNEHTEAYQVTKNGRAIIIDYINTNIDANYDWSDLEKELNGIIKDDIVYINILNNSLFSSALESIANNDHNIIVYDPESPNQYSNPMDTVDNIIEYDPDDSWDPFNDEDDYFEDTTIQHKFVDYVFEKYYHDLANSKHEYTLNRDAYYGWTWRYNGHTYVTIKAFDIVDFCEYCKLSNTLQNIEKIKSAISYKEKIYGVGESFIKFGYPVA